MFPVDAKILIVDDSGFSRSVLKSTLKELSYVRLLEAEDVPSAQKCLLEEEQRVDPVHLVITDQQMPEVSGLDFLKWLRGHERYKDIPVIMVTTNLEKSVILKAGIMGVSHYMLKPFDVNTLKERMVSAWTKHGQFYYHANKKAK